MFINITSKNWEINNPFRKLWVHFCNDSLFRNSVYLMLSTGVMAVFGFFFWILVARLYTTEQIGLATTMISVITFITTFSLLGLDIGLIRYLPKSKEKNEQINTSFLTTALATLVIVAVFLVELKTFSPKLFFIKENPYYIFLFIFFTVFSTSNSLIDNIFIAFRNAKFILIKNTIFSVLKFALPFILVSFGAYGIFGSYMGALVVGFAVSFIILIAKFKYEPRLMINQSTVKEVGRYSLGNYIAGFIGGLPTLALPLMITNMLKPEITAYYYMAMMIVGLLFIIPGATTQSLFAEGSHNEEEMKQHVIKAIKIIAIILVPAILVTVLFGNYILLVFGKNYSAEGFRFLQIIALSGIFVSINTVFGTILKIERRIKMMIFINCLSALLILGLSYSFISSGLLGIGIAWIIGQLIISIIYVALIKFFHINNVPAQTIRSKYKQESA
jgi:O-antigen/teichoic acid export membrane protein